jgi:hypothetical protein
VRISRLNTRVPGGSGVGERSSRLVASTPPGVVACRCPCFCVARSARVDDVAGVAALSLSVRIKDLLPDQHSALVGRLSHRAAYMNRHFRALCAVVIPGATLLAYAKCRAFGLLHGRLLNEHLHLSVQVLHLRRRGSGHGP